MKLKNVTDEAVLRSVAISTLIHAYGHLEKQRMKHRDPEQTHKRHDLLCAMRIIVGVKEKLYAECESISPLGVGL